jgi:DNA-binding NtrC family response regulator
MPDAWDLVLSDRTMPKITGEELARQVLAVRPDIPVVIMTGYGDPSDEQRTREIGITDFLFKPVVGPDLAAAVRRALEGTRPAKAA